MSKEKFIQKYSHIIIEDLACVSFDMLTQKFTDSNLAFLLSSRSVRIMLFNMTAEINEYHILDRV